MERRRVRTYTEIMNLHNMQPSLSRRSLTPPRIPEPQREPLSQKDQDEVADLFQSLSCMSKAEAFSALCQIGNAALLGSRVWQRYKNGRAREAASSREPVKEEREVRIADLKREGDYLQLDVPLTSAQKKRVEKTGAMLFEGGRIKAGSITHTNSQMARYHEYVAPDGKTYLSLKPLHDPYTDLVNKPQKTIEEILAAHRQLDAKFPGRFASPAGVHYVGGDLRILYEPIDGRLGAFAGEVPARYLQQIEQVFGKPSMGRYDTAIWEVIEEYTFILPDGTLRTGMPVRASNFVYDMERLGILD